MSRIRVPIILLAGAACGIGLVLACGDDSPSDADAAVCDCPASEPPLDGRIAQRPEVTAAIAANSDALQSNNCLLGTTLISGGCTLQTPDPLITLSESGPADDRTWLCRWNNPTGNANVGVVKVICLTPAE